METAAERLAWARRKAGFETAADAVRRYGWVSSTYMGHENGSRNYKGGSAVEYAKAFGVSASWLLTGERNGKAQTVAQFMGTVGAGAEVHPYLHEDASESIEAPPELPEGSAAIQVEGDSMWPAYRDGDTIFVGPPVRGYFEIRERGINRECLVEIEDGPTLIKVVQQGSEPNTFTLISYNGPPIQNVRIRCVAPVLWVKRKV